MFEIDYFQKRVILLQGHVFERAASAYVDQCVKNLSEGADLPVLFPPLRFTARGAQQQNQVTFLINSLEEYLF